MAIKCTNVWFRIILSELGRRDIQAMTQFPCSDNPLPADFSLLQSFETHVIQHQSATQPVNLSSPFAVKMDDYGRLAQAATLLDQVIAFNHTGAQRSLLEHIQLDGRIRDFLSVAISERGNTTTSGSTIVALTLRYEPHKAPVLP